MKPDEMPGSGAAALMIVTGWFTVSVTTYWKYYHAKGIMKIKEWEVVKGQLPFLK